MSVPNHSWGDYIPGLQHAAFIIDPQPAHYFLGGPTIGPDALPTFRALVTGDLPPGTGTVTSVASADDSITVTNPTTTVDLSVVKAPKWTTGRLLAGNTVDGSANVPFANKFIVQGTVDAGLSGAQFLGALGTGIVKNTTTTGILSIAIATDFPTLNQDTTGYASALRSVTTTVNVSSATAPTTGQILTATDSTHATWQTATVGTVVSVASADGSILVTNPTTTVDLAVVKAPKWSTARNLAGNSVDGSANVAFSNKFIVQGTVDSGLSSAQFLGALATGIVKNTITTGVLSIAVAADFPTLNQNTTGNAATATTATTATNLAGGAGGSVPYQSAAGTTAMLANGTSGQILQSNGGTAAPSWLTNLAIAHGGTGATTAPTARGNLRIEQIFNVLDYGATGDGSTDDTAAIQAAIDACNTAGGGIVYFPVTSDYSSNGKYYKCNSQLNMTRYKNVELRGPVARGMQSFAAVNNDWCTIIYTGTGSYFLDLQRSCGILIQGINWQYSSGSFTGNLLDTNVKGTSGGDTGYNLIVRQCTFGSTGSSIHSARCGIYLAGMVYSNIENCAFSWMDYGIIGFSIAIESQNFSTAANIYRNWFDTLGIAGIANPERGWRIVKNVFEYTRGLAAGGIVTGAFAGVEPSQGLTIVDNEFWDVTTGGGVWIDYGGSHALNCTGNKFDLGSSATAIKLRNNITGVNLAGNSVLGSSGATWVNANSATVNGFCDNGTNGVDPNTTLLANATNVHYATQTFGETSINHLIGFGATASGTDQPGAGTGASHVVTGNAMRGTVTVTTGTAPAAASKIITVSFGDAYAVAPVIISLTPANANAAALTGATQVYADNIGTTSFDVISGATALAGGSTVYKWYYLGVQ